MWTLTDCWHKHDAEASKQWNLVAYSGKQNEHYHFWSGVTDILSQTYSDECTHWKNPTCSSLTAFEPFIVAHTIQFIHVTKAFSSGRADFVYETPGRDPSPTGIWLPCWHSTITVESTKSSPSGPQWDCQGYEERRFVWACWTLKYPGSVSMLSWFHPHETITITRHSQINGFSTGKNLSLAFIGSSASARSTGRVPKRLQITFFLSTGLQVKMELIKAFFTSPLLTITLNRICCLESKYIFQAAKTNFNNKKFTISCFSHR